MQNLGHIIVEIDGGVGLKPGVGSKIGPRKVENAVVAAKSHVRDGSSW